MRTTHDGIGRTYCLVAVLALACAESPVEPALVGTLAVQPPTATLDIGFTQQFTGMLLDSTGVPFAMPDSVHWLSWDTTVVTITWEGGLATARRPGVGRIRATLGHLQDTVEVTVRPLVLASVALGKGISCALTESQLGYCWGENEGGQLGDGTTEWRSIPGLVAGGLHFVAISAHTDHACGVIASGEAYCWGSNVTGRLGDGVGTQETRLVPTPVLGGLTFASVHAGGWFSCGLAVGGEAWCWGANARGSLGFDPTASGGGGVASSCDTTSGGNSYCAAPVPVAGGLTFASLTTGGLNACGVTPSGDAYCWGASISGALGDGTVTDRSEPVAVVGDFNWEWISTGVDHTCGVVVGGAAYCWGSNWLGELGDGTGVGSFVPVPVAGGLTFQTVGAGTLHTCGLTTDGVAYCWGDNLAGKLGQPFAELESSLVPVAVSGGHTFTSLDVGADHSCGRATDGLFYCWGANVFGQLGIGTVTAGSYEPVAIFGQQ